uniref:Major facilitator superfamily (MFS) profile domain-containing protein n=1 Tax=Timema cristinae TaxID=61476 RepID=A0A7R9D6A0_TIMCR|nr:unnamed protein product [Timema cristinae]
MSITIACLCQQDGVFLAIYIGIMWAPRLMGSTSITIACLCQQDGVFLAIYIGIMWAPRRCIPARYVFLAVSVLGALTSSIMRVSMSVAIVAMVRTTNTTTNSSLQTDTDTCPGQEVVTSSSGSEKGGQEEGRRGGKQTANQRAMWRGHVIKFNHSEQSQGRDLFLSCRAAKLAPGMCHQGCDSAMASTGNPIPTGRGTQTGEFEWDEMTQSYILTGGIYGSLVTVLIGARLAEMFGNKRVCGIAMFMSAIINILSPICVRWNVAAFIAAKVLQGFFTGPFMPANMALFASWLPPQERARMSGIIFSASNIGSLISMGISGKMASTFGWESLFYVYGVLTALWCVLWMFFVHESPETHPWISDEEKDYIVSNTKKVAIVTYANLGVQHIIGLLIVKYWPIRALLAFSVGTSGGRTIVACFGLLFILVFVVSMLDLHVSLLQANIHASYITALPYLAGWLSNVTSGITSQWLRQKGYVSHMTAYRIFNGIGTSQEGEMASISDVDIDVEVTDDDDDDIEDQGQEGAPANTESENTLSQFLDSSGNSGPGQDRKYYN